jgi:hypothetical protein
MQKMLPCGVLRPQNDLFTIRLPPALLTVR